MLGLEYEAVGRARKLRDEERRNLSILEFARRQGRFHTFPSVFGGLQREISEKREREEK